MAISRWHSGGAALAAVAVVLAGPVPGALGHEKGNANSAGHRVVAEGLDNPRQINWTSDGESLVVAEAGRGGDQCSEAGCAGPTGAITLIENPGSHSPTVSTPVEGFISFASPDGSFAVGSNGVDALETTENGFVVAGSDPSKPPMLGGSLLFAVPADVEAGLPAPLIIPLADLQAAEEAQNPDGAQIESNPYATLFVDPTPKGEPGVDGYALVADAAANTVWKVEPDLSYEPPAELGCFTSGTAVPECFSIDISVFVTYPTTPLLPDGTEDPEGDPEFVPTSLATNRRGHIYVGGLGSEVPGAASVVKYTADGHELARWDGFTGITGIAVDHKSLYVSQLFGSAAPLPEGETPQDEAPPTAGTVPGQVVMFNESRRHPKRWAIDVPLPAGLASDSKHVYASVNSIAPAEGVTGGPFGAVGGGAVWELDFSDAYQVDEVAVAP